MPWWTMIETDPEIVLHPSFDAAFEYLRASRGEGKYMYPTLPSMHNLREHYGRWAKWRS